MVFSGKHNGKNTQEKRWGRCGLAAAVAAADRRSVSSVSSPRDTGPETGGCAPAADDRKPHGDRPVRRCIPDP